MADFTITISNTLGVYGAEATNKWGVMEWGDNWGYGDIDLVTTVYKLIDAGSIASDSTVANSLGKTITNTLICNGDMYSEKLYDAAGYYIVFVKDSNAENRSLTSYSEINSGVGTYSQVSIPSTTWAAA
jgi:hypothetical protein